MYSDDNFQQPTSTNNLKSNYSQVNTDPGLVSSNLQNNFNKEPVRQNLGSQSAFPQATTVGNVNLSTPIASQPVVNAAPTNSIKTVNQTIDQNNNFNYSNNINNNSVTNTDIPESLNFNSEGEVLEKEDIPVKNSAKSGLLKLLLLILPVIIISVIVMFVVLNNKQKQYFKQQEVLLSVPMKNTNWQDIGKVFEPIIPVDVKTTDGYKHWEFLIDSGAVISSLPRDWAQKMGLDLALLRRSTFRGFGNATSFAYHGEMTIKLGEKEFVVPVVFTEATGTKSLLGRKGFFQDHSIYFNHVSKQIEIRN